VGAHIGEREKIRKGKKWPSRQRENSNLMGARNVSKRGAVEKKTRGGTKKRGERAELSLLSKKPQEREIRPARAIQPKSRRIWSLTMLNQREREEVRGDLTRESKKVEGENSIYHFKGGPGTGEDALGEEEGESIHSLLPNQKGRRGPFMAGGVLVGCLSIHENGWKGKMKKTEGSAVLR